MTSSLRDRPLEETLAAAKKAAQTLGITRVTDTTWLDYIGIPVYASIRADSLTVCVNSGKGARPAEAMVGAYMEAIEFALAEPRNSSLNMKQMSVRELLEQKHARFSMEEFRPRSTKRMSADTLITCVEAEDILTGDKAWIPAELVFVPFREGPGRSIFGSSTNGLSSGNSIDEATAHGICEIIERDVQSFLHVGALSSHFVELGESDGQVFDLASKVARAGLEYGLRFAGNEYNLPYFEGYVIEKGVGFPLTAAGYGLHPFKSIAAVRALAEAAQSRLTYIHGGRGDLVRIHEQFPDPKALERAMLESNEHAMNRQSCVTYSSIEGMELSARTSAELVAGISSILVERGFSHIFRVVLSPPDFPVSVVKTVIPRMEHYNPGDVRTTVGPRLNPYFDR
ncbi:YcaO-like family protein [Streptomyces sp. NPDC006207]